MTTNPDEMRQNNTIIIVMMMMMAATKHPYRTTPHHSAVYVHASNILQLFITESYTQSEHKRAQKQSANTILA